MLLIRNGMVVLQQGAVVVLYAVSCIASRFCLTKPKGGKNAELVLGLSYVCAQYEHAPTFKSSKKMFKIQILGVK